MHELQMASDLMRTVMEAFSERPGALRVEEVHVRLGRLSFFGTEQLDFCWEAITEGSDTLGGSKLVFSFEEPEVRCASCGRLGPLDIKEDPLFHQVLPVFACPACGSGVEIVKGKGVSITGIKILVEDGGGEG